MKREFLVWHNQKLNFPTIGKHRKEDIPVIWSTGITCPYNCKDCYAKTARVRYHHVVPQYRDWHFEETKKASYVNGIIAEVLSKFKRGDIFRFHGTEGEVYSIDYARKILDIVKTFPDIRFMMYTKKMDFCKEVGLIGCKNINIINSIMPEGSFNFGDDSFIKYWSKKGYFVCPAVKNKNIKCCTCLACATKKKVIFPKHK